MIPCHGVNTGTLRWHSTGNVKTSVQALESTCGPIMNKPKPKVEPPKEEEKKAEEASNNSSGSGDPAQQEQAATDPQQPAAQEQKMGDMEVD